MIPAALRKLADRIEARGDVRAGMLLLDVDDAPEAYWLGGPMPHGSVQRLCTEALVDHAEIEAMCGPY